MLEGDSWKDAKMEKAKIDKMSGEMNAFVFLVGSLTQYRSANRAALRAHAADQKQIPRGCRCRERKNHCNTGSEVEAR